jgi:hypothetical protein
VKLLGWLLLLLLFALLLRRSNLVQLLLLLTRERRTVSSWLLLLLLLLLHFRTAQFPAAALQFLCTFFSAFFCNFAQALVSRGGWRRGCGGAERRVRMRVTLGASMLRAYHLHSSRQPSFSSW